MSNLSAKVFMPWKLFYLQYQQGFLRFCIVFLKSKFTLAQLYTMIPTTGHGRGGGKGQNDRGVLV